MMNKNYSSQIANEICEAITNSENTLIKLCKEHQHWPSTNTIYRWLKDYPEFGECYRKAKQAREIKKIKKYEKVIRKQLKKEFKDWLLSRIGFNELSDQLKKKIREAK